MSVTDAAAVARMQSLRDRLLFLRALHPGSPAYKLWLGDLVELVNETWGTGSPQGKEIVDVLGAQGAVTGAGVQAPTAYLQRLDRFDMVLAEFESTLL